MHKALNRDEMIMHLTVERAKLAFAAENENAEIIAAIDAWIKDLQEAKVA